MSSSTFLNDLAENFFLCSVCLDQFQEPKQLPCLHRYCTECLRMIIHASQDGSITCPMCNHVCFVPDKGVDGFKTDFHIKNMIGFIQLQKSFNDKEVKKCVSCSKNTNVSAYCFKCKEFLCDNCYKVHVGNKMFTDHQPHTLKLDNIESHNQLTLEKLSALTEDPRCDTHVKKEAHLCCSSCGNVPVCVACTYSNHKGHDLRDVTELAKSERELLKPKLAELNIHKSKIYELQKSINAVKGELFQNVRKKTDALVSQHKQQAQRIKGKLIELTSVRERGMRDIENRRKEEGVQTNMKFEEEMRQVRQKYDEIMKETQRKYDDETNEFKTKCDVTESDLHRNLGLLDVNLKNLTTDVETHKTENENELKELSNSCEQIIQRYENFTATTTSVLASKDEWTDARCIPDIRAACEPLLKELKREFPRNLKSLSNFVISDVKRVITDDVKITEQTTSSFGVAEIKDKGWSVYGITSSNDGNIVITGRVSNEYSHITVIDRKGETTRRGQIKREKCRYYPDRNCCFLSKSKVITICVPDEIGLYDVLDGSYDKKKIGDVTTNWPVDRCVWCVTNDHVNHRIIVGTNSRYVYVFDDQINYSHTVTLPDVISYAFDMVSPCGGMVIICDILGKRSYAVTMDKSQSKLMYEFVTPDLDGYNCRPLRVCTDKNGFIYMLWAGNSASQEKRVLVQYNQDGRQILATRVVDEDTYCVTTSEMDGKEQLLVATQKTGKLFTYGLSR